MPFEDSIINDANEVQSINFKFGKPGDGFKGTLLSIKVVEVMDDKLKRPVPKKIYEFRAHAGSFWNFKMEINNETGEETVKFDEKETVIAPGDIIKQWSRGSIFDDDMKSLKPGMIAALKFTGYGKAKPGKSPAKIVKIYKGGVDPGYMGESADDLANIEKSFNEQPPM